MLWYENGLNFNAEHFLEEILLTDYLGYYLGEDMLMVSSSTIDKNIEISDSMFEFILNKRPWKALPFLLRLIQ